jgi:hypothetical protein
MKLAEKSMKLIKRFISYPHASGSYRNWFRGLFVPLIACCLMGATHGGPKWDRRPRYALDAFAKVLAKEHQLEFLNSGVGLIADADRAIWAISLVSRRQMTLEQGRQFATAIAHKLYRKVLNDPLFGQYCQEMSSFYSSSEVKKEYVAFRLAFWDKNTNRPLYPFLAQIRLADGNLFYHYADPETQALQPPIVEAWIPEND